jgi:hypothetical protein
MKLLSLTKKKAIGVLESRPLGARACFSGTTGVGVMTSRTHLAASDTFLLPPRIDVEHGRILAVLKWLHLVTDQPQHETLMSCSCRTPSLSAQGPNKYTFGGIAKN